MRRWIARNGTAVSRGVRQAAVRNVFVTLVAAHHQADSAETLPANPQASVNAALQSLNALFQGPPILRADHWAAAFRPVPGDGLPALGPVARGLWLAVLHSGVTLGPLVAETLAAEVLGARASPLLSPFRPARFWP